MGEFVDNSVDSGTRKKQQARAPLKRNRLDDVAT